MALYITTLSIFAGEGSYLSVMFIVI